MAGPKGHRALASLLEDWALKLPLDQIAQAAIALRAAAPGDRAVWAATDDIVHSSVPRWHWHMLQDRARARAYHDAIHASVRPGMLVLEIGAGTGVLAMMAARAGADHVYTVEANPLIAEIARKCIAGNGLSDRITVLSKHSSRLVIGRDLPRRADLLIHEILSSSALTEGLAPTITHARAALLTPEAPLLPEFIGIEAVLSGDLTAGEAPWWQVEGFTLAPLALLDAAVHGVPGKAPRKRMSAATGVAEIDLLGSDLMRERAFTGPMVADRSGTVTGVEQWMKVLFPGGISLSSRDPKSHWGTCYHPFGCSRTVAAGEQVNIEVTVSDRRLAVGLVGADAEAPSGWQAGL